MSVRTQLDPESGVLTVTLADPSRRNPLSAAMVQGLRRALAGAAEDEAVRAVLLTGEGEAFSAGGDIREFASSLERPALEVYRESEGLARLFQEAGEFRKPIVGAINGWALGGGCGLVCLCHIAIASERARIGTTEVRIGMFPMIILPALRRAVGERRALEMALTGRILEAVEAERIGLFHRVVPHERLQEEAMATARLVAGWSPVAVGVGLAGFAATRDVTYREAVDHLNALRQVIQQSEDLREGTQAFLEKRRPAWKGR